MNKIDAIRLLADVPIAKEKAMRKDENVRLKDRTSAPQIESHTNYSECKRWTADGGRRRGARGPRSRGRGGGESSMLSEGILE